MNLHNFGQSQGIGSKIIKTTKSVTIPVPETSNTLAIGAPQKFVLKPYSKDIRAKVIEAYRRGDGSQREIAARFDVSLSFVRDLMRLIRETGDIEPRQRPRNGMAQSKIDSETLDLILRLKGQQPSLSLSQMCNALAVNANIRVSRSTLWRAIARDLKDKAHSNGWHKQNGEKP